MNSKEYYKLFRYLIEHCNLLLEDIVFVTNISEWCSRHGIHENDSERPFKVISEEGARLRMLIQEDISDAVMHERVTAIWVRSQRINVAFDRADLLDSDRKKWRFFFLANMPQVFLSFRRIN